MFVMPVIMFAGWVFTGCSGMDAEEPASVLSDDDSGPLATRANEYGFEDEDAFWEALDNEWAQNGYESQAGFVDGGLLTEGPSGDLLFGVYAAGPIGVQSGHTAEYELKFYSADSWVTLNNINWQFSGYGAQIISGQGTSKVRVQFYSPSDVRSQWSVSLTPSNRESITLNRSTTIYRNWVTFTGPETIRVGETATLIASYPNAQSYEWDVLPNRNGFEIVSLTGNTMRFKISQPGNHYIVCRAKCSWGSTEWYDFQPIIAE